MAAALLDRVLQHCHIVNIRSNSCRIRVHIDLESGLTPDEPSGQAQGEASRPSTTGQDPELVS